MSEIKEVETVKPANTKKLEHDMSVAPFLGVAKIEFEESYKNFEDAMKEMEKNKACPWLDFFTTQAQLEPKLKDGALIVVETKKYRCIYDLKPGYESHKFKTDDRSWPTPFMTWEEVVARLLMWKDTKFDPSLIVEPERHCINRNFRHVHIFKHKRGYIWANQFDMVYPAEIMASTILLGK